MEDGVALTIEPGISDLAEVSSGRHSAITSDTHPGR